MSKQDMLELEGVVVEALPNATFQVELANAHKPLAHISGFTLRTHQRAHHMAFKINADKNQQANF